MECPESERPGFPALLSGTTVNIDHHPGNTRWATHNLVVLPAAAVGEIVADLLDRLEWPMTPGIATNLWVSLVSDTGSFRYGNTTARALALGARLVTEGVRPDVVNEFLYEARPLSTIRLETLVLGRSSSTTRAASPSSPFRSDSSPSRAPTRPTAKGS